MSENSYFEFENVFKVSCKVINPNKGIYKGNKADYYSSDLRIIYYRRRWGNNGLLELLLRLAENKVHVSFFLFSKIFRLME